MYLCKSYCVIILFYTKVHRNVEIMFSTKCTSKARLDGKTAIVTGSNTGIGKVTVQEFYRLGEHIRNYVIL